MEMLKRFVTQIRKKSKTPSNVNKTDSAKEIPLKKTVNMTTSTKDSDDDLAVTVIQKPDKMNDVEIAKNLTKDYVKDIGIASNENKLNTILNIEDENITCNKVNDKNVFDDNLVLLEKLLNKTSKSVTLDATNMFDSEEKNVIKDKDMNNQHNDVGNIGNEATALNLGFESNLQIDATNIMLKLDEKLTTYKNKCTLVRTITSKSPTKDITDEYTAEYLEEFDSVLAEVQIKDDKNSDSLSLDDLENILKVLDDISYNYQDIKHDDDISVGELLRTDIMLPGNTNDERDIEVVSINSNDSEANNEFETKDITNFKNNIDGNEKIIGDKIDIISISSDDSQNELNIFIINVDCEITEYDGKIEFDTSKLTENEDVDDNRDNFAVKMDITKEHDIFNKEMNQLFNTAEYHNWMNGVPITSTDCVTHNEGTEVNKRIYAEKTDVFKENNNIFDKDLNNLFNFDNKENVDAVSNKSANSDTEDDCGYHSSDFEFITEEEAKMDGLVININKERHGNAKKSNNGIKKVPYDPNRPGTSATEQRLDNSERQLEVEGRENYVVPEENDFLNMFRDVVPGMTSSEIHFLENKSVRIRAPMLIQYEGIGFDMNVAMRRGDNFQNEEYREEADESLKKIIEMYPCENSRRKRRRRF